MRQDAQLSLGIGPIPSTESLVALAASFRPWTVKGWTDAEQKLLATSSAPLEDHETAIAGLAGGLDPLGDLFCRLRSAEVRRSSGATYTPHALVAAMLNWAGDEVHPVRVVDPGTGSARFLAAAGKRFPAAELVGFELDPLAALLARANLSAQGLGKRAEVIVGDYRLAALPAVDGPTLFIGNPPYVRHHLIEPQWKNWLIREAKQLGARASQLAGLHAYFFLATARIAAKGDVGVFVTAAEWLDVNYGSLIRDLFLGRLGGQKLIVIEPTARPFPDAATTAAISCFRIGEQPRTIQVQRVTSIDEMRHPKRPRRLRRQRFEAEARWSRLTRSVKKCPAGFVELGETFRVHRGQVTGANRIWIAGPHSAGLPQSVLYPTVTKALELFRAGKELIDPSALRNVIDIPSDLSTLPRHEREQVDSFLRYARDAGAHLSYIAANRKAWWSVGLRQPAPILATYMARRPPAFVRNRAAARHINIAHGLYPREDFGDDVLDRIVEYLSTTTELASGRTYAGGLTKFEPREMERILVPRVEELQQATA